MSRAYSRKIANTPWCRIAMLPVLVGCLVCSGCVGATRLPARSKGPQGASLQKSDLDLSFLQAGTARREDVLSKLHSIDTAYSNPRLFWGRWSDSKWGYWWFVASQTYAAGDAKRVWHVHNLLVTFDQNGVVQTRTVIDDNRALWRELHAQLAEMPPLDLTQPVTLPILRSDSVEITLSKDAIHIERRKASKSFDVSAIKVVRFRHVASIEKGSSPGTSCHALELAEKTRSGKAIRFCVAPPDVVTLFLYLREHGPADMAWE